MYGASQEAIDDARPTDFLPYVVGYMAAMAGSDPEPQGKGGPNEISPEYYRGYERGQNVRAGKCPAPGWIKTANTGAAQ